MIILVSHTGVINVMLLLRQSKQKISIMYAVKCNSQERRAKVSKQAPIGGGAGTMDTIQKI